MRHPSILGPSLLGLAATGLLAVPCGAAILHVNAGLVGGANDGTSWDNAFVGVDALANALAASNNGDQIWVAAGLYRPTAGSSRTISLTLKTGVAVYGGFEGSEAVLEERDWTANETVLSGDLAENDPLVNDKS